MTYGRFEEIRGYIATLNGPPYGTVIEVNLVEVVAYVEYLLAEREKTLLAAFYLASYAASINWDDETPNTGEWLEDLKSAIERVQALGHEKGLRSNFTTEAADRFMQRRKAVEG